MKWTEHLSQCLPPQQAKHIYIPFSLWTYNLVGYIQNGATFNSWTPEGPIDTWKREVSVWWMRWWGDGAMNQGSVWRSVCCPRESSTFCHSRAWGSRWKNTPQTHPAQYPEAVLKHTHKQYKDVRQGGPRQLWSTHTNNAKPPSMVCRVALNHT